MIFNPPNVFLIVLQEIPSALYFPLNQKNQRRDTKLSSSEISKRRKVFSQFLSRVPCSPLPVGFAKVSRSHEITIACISPKSTKLRRKPLADQIYKSTKAFRERFFSKGHRNPPSEESCTDYTAHC